MYDEKDLLDPFLLFEKRTRLIFQRIQVLNTDYTVMQHPVSKSIIINILEELVDDYVDRSLVLQRSKEEDESDKANIRDRIIKS